MTHGLIVTLAALGVLGQALAVLLLLIGLLWLLGLRVPLRALRRSIWGYELWLAFLVSAVATGRVARLRMHSRAPPTCKSSS
jgi:beta-lactamase regulating signal transducer with metallopeptidase domain